MSAPDRPFNAGEMLRVLVVHKVDFVVAGGVAVQAHGYLRGTGDLDVIPRPSMLNLSRLGEALADLEAEVWRANKAVDITDPHLLRGAPLVPLITRVGRLDLLNSELVDGGLPYDRLRDHALVIEVNELAVPVVSRDDLIRMKRAAGRPQDIADIGALSRADVGGAEETTKGT